MNTIEEVNRLLNPAYGFAPWTKPVGELVELFIAAATELSDVHRFLAAEREDVLKKFNSRFFLVRWFLIAMKKAPQPHRIYTATELLQKYYVPKIRNFAEWLEHRNAYSKTYYHKLDDTLSSVYRVMRSLKSMR